VLGLQNRGLRNEIKKLNQPKKIDYDTYLSILKLHTQYKNHTFSPNGIHNELELDWDTINALIGKYIDLSLIEKITTIECDSCGHMHDFKNSSDLFNTQNCTECNSLLSKSGDWTYTKYQITQKGLNQKPVI